MRPSDRWRVRASAAKGLLARAAIEKAADRRTAAERSSVRAPPGCHIHSVVSSIPRAMGRHNKPDLNHRRQPRARSRMHDPQRGETCAASAQFSISHIIVRTNPYTHTILKFEFLFLLIEKKNYLQTITIPYTLSGDNFSQFYTFHYLIFIILSLKLTVLGSFSYFKKIFVL